MREHRKSARDVADRAIRSELDMLIEEANLSEEECEIIRLKFGKRWSNVKIAYHMNLSEQTVGRRIERAYDKLHKVIQEALPF